LQPLWISLSLISQVKGDERMPDHNRPQGLIRDVITEGNGGDGVHIENADVIIDGLQSRHNEGRGLYISNETEQKHDGDGAPHDHWYKKPIGILGLSIAAALLSAAAIWAISYSLS
jgi:hypothetical protein